MFIFVYDRMLLRFKDKNENVAPVGILTTRAHRQFLAKSLLHDLTSFNKLGESHW